MRTFGLIGAVLAVALLAGCTTFGTVAPVVTQTQIYVPSIPSSLYNCPIVKTLPNPATLTNGDVAKLIKDLSKASRTCKTNMDGIKAYIHQLQVAADKANGKTPAKKK